MIIIIFFMLHKQFFIQLFAIKTVHFFRKYNNGIKQPATGVPIQEYIFSAGKCLHLSAGKVCSGYSFSDCSDQ